MRYRANLSSSCLSSCLGVFVVTSAACAAHHTTTGLVLKVDRPGATVTISHDAFPGYMDAMAMPFDLKGDARTAKLNPGDRVKFRLSVKGGRSWVDRVDVVSAARVDAGLGTPRQCRPTMRSARRCRLRVDRSHREAGRPSALKGKVVAVTFIYSRCPLPDYARAW
jgi:protein SCO1/2